MLFPVLACSAYLDAEVDIDDPDRPVYLLGESFGAVLALAVAAAKTDLVDRLVLVNPATSYENSIWPRLGPALAKLPDVRPCCHPQATHACAATLMHGPRLNRLDGMLSMEALLLGRECVLPDVGMSGLNEVKSSSRLMLIRQEKGASAPGQMLYCT